MSLVGGHYLATPTPVVLGVTLLWLPAMGQLGYFSGRPGAPWEHTASQPATFASYPPFALLLHSSKVN